MRWLASIIAVVTSVGLTGCSGRHPTDGQADTSGPHFANLCVGASARADVIQYMKAFAARRGLEFHGEEDNFTPDNRPEINAYVAQGYNYYFGDDFDVWLVGDPFRPSVVYVNGVVKRMPVTREQNELAKTLLAGLSNITKPAQGPPDNPNCIASTERNGG
jgi:hypothetical protein